MFSVRHINAFRVKRMRMMSDVGRAYPIRNNGMSDVFAAAKPGAGEICLQLMDDLRGASYFFKPFIPEDGWRFYWATGKEERAHFFVCRKHGDQLVIVSDNPPMQSRHLVQL